MFHRYSYQNLDKIRFSLNDALNFSAVGLILYNVRQRNTVDEVLKLILRLCTGLGVRPTQECKGIIAMFGVNESFQLRVILFT